MQTFDVSGHQYAGVKRDFILKVDGDRPILYSLDYINTTIYYLLPIQGFVLSLLDGRTPISELTRTFAALFPQAEWTLLDLLRSVDTTVRQSPSQTGIGKNGLIDVSDDPIVDAQRFDPREFIISPKEFSARKFDPKLSLRLDAPIVIYTIFTHRCLTNCAYCYADRPKTTEMPLARWRDIVREMRGLGIWLAAPDNGDTFARRDGIELLECLLEYEMHFLLSTKAYVSKEYVKRLIDAGFTKKLRGVIQRQVQLSVDAVDDDVSRHILNIKHSNVSRKS